MAIFHCYVKLPEGMCVSQHPQAIGFASGASISPGTTAGVHAFNGHPVPLQPGHATYAWDTQWRGLLDLEHGFFGHLDPTRALIKIRTRLQ